MTKALRSNNFFKNYSDYTQWQESPLDFHNWVGLTIIGAATRHRLYYNMAYFKIYPNLYTTLIASSALCKKSVAMDLGMDIFLEAFPEDLTKPRIIRGSITPNAILDVLSRGIGDDGEVPELFIQADEMSLLLSTMMISLGLPALLTRLYMGGVHDYRTQTSATYNIPDSFVTVLAGTVPTDIRNAPDEVVRQGFIGRFYFIHRENMRGVFALPAEVADMSLLADLRGVLIEQLIAIGTREGKVRLSSEAKKWFDGWYRGFIEEEKRREIPPDDDTKTVGFVGRKGVTCIKLAILSHLGANPFEVGEVVLSEKDFIIAADLVRDPEGSLSTIFSHVPMDKFAEAQNKIVDFILSKKKVSRTSLTVRWFQKLGLPNMDRILYHLKDQNFIIEIRESRKRYYCYVPEDLREENRATIEEVLRKEYGIL